MYAKVGPDGRVEDVTFEGEGCTISMAAASYVTEMVQGMTLEEVEDLSFETLIDDLGPRGRDGAPDLRHRRPRHAQERASHELRMKRLAAEE